MQIYRLRLREWSNAYYSGAKKPALITLKRRIDKGVIPGSKASGEYIVYCNAHYEPIQPLQATQLTAAEQLAQRILANHAQT